MSAHRGPKREDPPAEAGWPWRRMEVAVDGRRYRATVSEGPHNWSAHVRRLPGLVTTGPYVGGALDRDLVRDRLREAIAFHIEGLAIEAAQRV